MSPCQPLSFEMPDGPSGPSIPGFGQPFVVKTPNLKLNVDFPEDLMDILQKLQLLLPPGSLKPQLSRNFGKDVFDGIMKLIDQFMPFLMLYKFFLPILNLIICIIEVLCAIPNPVKLVNALVKLFRNCIPEFLNLFPIFALILMIISLILLLVALIEYIIQELIKLVQLIIKNIKTLSKAFQLADEKAILAVIKKLGAILCAFQNLFVLLAVYTSILQTIKEMLGLIFALPPCDDNAECCTTDVCPEIVKSEYTRNTGVFKYLNKVVETTEILPGVYLKDTVRNESWQLYDEQQLLLQQFINIVNAADIPASDEPKPIFFPTDVVYSKETSPKQSAYTIDLRLFYNPINWGRTGLSRYIRIKNCIVLHVPKTYLLKYNNTAFSMPSGVLNLAGGTVYEDDGKTKIEGFEYGLDSFLHLEDRVSSNPFLSPTDGYLFPAVEYTFKPNIPVLMSKNLVTAGCSPELALNKAFVNNAFAGDIALRLQLANNVPLPDTNLAQECLNVAISKLENNLTEEGAAEFQAEATQCLENLKAECLTALNSFIPIGFDPCKSDFSIQPKIQFTSQVIKVSVNIKDKNGVNLAVALPAEVGQELAKKIKGHATFGNCSSFTYDGVQSFSGEISSSNAGAGDLMISFDNNIFCTNNIPTDINTDPTRELQQITYEFVYAPVAVPVGEGNVSDGAPRRDESDISGGNSENNGGV